MLASLNSATLVGIKAVPVRVEVDIHPGLPRFSVVGLPGTGVTEAYDRVWAAMRNSGFQPPLRCVTVNLAPGDVRKEGPSFDLPIALGVLAAGEEQIISQQALEQTLILGELAMDGAVRPVRGVLSALLMASSRDIKRVVVPWANGAEAALLGNMQVMAVRTLNEAVSLLNGQAVPELPHAYGSWCDDDNSMLTAGAAVSPGRDLSLVCGQHLARQALEICAAGGHHLLLLGPPGSGKTMLAQCLPSIMPPLTAEQALEVTAVHSAMSKAAVRQLIANPPFRAPASNVTAAGLMGGAQPGEISLAHHGVLFLDELAEYSRNCLEALRAPLESGTVEIARARLHVTYPCRFVLAAAMNPCPCGYLGDKERECTCSFMNRRRYFHRISGPLLDRIDLQVQVFRPSAEELLSSKANESSLAVRQRVLQAINIQRQRGGSNAGLSPEATKRCCVFDKETQQYLLQAIKHLKLSARVKDRASRVARTIADLAGRARIELSDLCTALEFRALDRSMNLLT